MVAASMVPEQIPGNYQRVPFSSGQSSCPERLYVHAVEVLTLQTGTLYVIPHKNFFFRRFATDKGLQCDSNPAPSNSGLKVSATVLRRMDQVQVNKTIDILTAFYNAPNEIFYLGYEVGARKCGLHTTPDKQISLWAVPGRQIKGSHAGLTITFKAGVKYLYYFDDTEPCLYEGNAAEQGTPSQIPPASSANTGSGDPVANDGKGTTTTSSGTVVSPDNQGEESQPQGGASPSPSSPTTTGSDSGDSTGGRTAKDNPECFPGNAVLLLRTGKSITMDQAHIGDVVLSGRNQRTGQLVYSPIVMFSHRSPSQLSTQLVRLRTETNLTITATAGHMIYVNGVLRRVGSVTADGTDTVHDVASGKMARVIHVGRVSSDAIPQQFKHDSCGTIRQATLGISPLGLYNPHTYSGDIVVDGIQASCYTSALSARFAHNLLWPVRLWFAVGGNTQLLSSALERFSELLIALRQFYTVYGEYVIHTTAPFHIS